MAKNIELMGAVFPDVPSIKLPQYGGGLVSFDDTSDADAVAGDIAQGKTAYVNGVKIVGTNQGGGGGGSSVAPRKDVNFIDYDGTIVYSYSASEFADLAEMPQNPSHTGLVAQGWNWSLTDAKAQVATSDCLTIGQMYITDDGKTRIYIHLNDERKSPMLGVCPNGTVDVDWGDGTEHDTLTGTSLSTVKWTPTHNYVKSGDYVISLTVTGKMAILGDSNVNAYCRLLRQYNSADKRNNYYIGAINKIKIGDNVSISSYAFSHCTNLTNITIPNGTSILGNAFDGCSRLTSITIPENVTAITNNTFSYCSSCESVAIPHNITSIGTYIFSSCYNLASIIIPNGIASINGSVFYNCSHLTSITIPESVTAITNSAFNSCYSLAEYHMRSTTPPKLSGSIRDMADDCIIYVPYSEDHSILEAYKTAANWSTYASKMQEEPA